MSREGGRGTGPPGAERRGPLRWRALRLRWTLSLPLLVVGVLALAVLAPALREYGRAHSRVSALAAALPLPPESVPVTERRYATAAVVGPLFSSILFGEAAYVGADVLFASNDPPDAVLAWYDTHLDSQRWGPTGVPHGVRPYFAAFHSRPRARAGVALTVRWIWPPDEATRSETQYAGDYPRFAASGRIFGYAAEMRDDGCSFYDQCGDP